MRQALCRAFISCTTLILIKSTHLADRLDKPRVMEVAYPKGENPNPVCFRRFPILCSAVKKTTR